MENNQTNRLIGELKGQVETLIGAFHTLQDICTMQGRHDERISSLEKFRTGVWALGLLVVPTLLFLAAKALQGGAR